MRRQYCWLAYKPNKHKLLRFELTQMAATAIVLLPQRTAAVRFQEVRVTRGEWARRLAVGTGSAVVSGDLASGGPARGAWVGGD